MPADLPLLILVDPQSRRDCRRGDVEQLELLQIPAPYSVPGPLETGGRDFVFVLFVMFVHSQQAHYETDLPSAFASSPPDSAREMNSAMAASDSKQPAAAPATRAIFLLLLTTSTCTCVTCVRVSITGLTLQCPRVAAQVEVVCMHCSESHSSHHPAALNSSFEGN